MLVISNNEMLSAEKAAADGGISFETMMQNAGRAVRDLIIGRFPKSSTLVICGPGNNGGDGLVVAKLLTQSGWPVTVMCDENNPYDKKTLSLLPLGQITSAAELSKYELIIDAVFGSGLSRPVEGRYAQLFELINSLDNTAVVSIDIPSGINGNSGEIHGQAIRADITVTFQAYKAGHLLFPGRDYSGEVAITDIGIDSQFFPQNKHLNSPKIWRHVIPKLSYDSHKYSRGHLCIIGGDMPGATTLTAMAGQRVTAGIVTVVMPNENEKSCYATLPPSIIRAHNIPDNISSIVIGPGMDASSQTKDLTLTTIKKSLRCVIDAGSLSAFADDKEALFSAFEQKQVVLTPHRGEFSRLFSNITQTNKLYAAIEAAKQSGAVVVLKGADTVIASPSGDAIINDNAQYGLSTAGSGDILSGIIGSLLASGIDAYLAAAAAVWIHGASSAPYMTAEDIIPMISNIMNRLARL